MPGNVALHFNPRLDRGYIVRNSKSRNSWENEETCSPAVPSSAVFERDSYFQLIIFCGTNEFFVSRESRTRIGIFITNLDSIEMEKKIVFFFFLFGFFFQIAINGEHFCEFHYRLPLETIEALEIVGGVEDVRTRVTNLCIYPDPKICKPTRNLKLNEKRPIFEDLVRVFQFYSQYLRV